MSYLPWVLIALAFPVTPLVVNWIRHRPKYLEEGVGSQHIATAGTVVQMILLCLGLALLVPRWL